MAVLFAEAWGECKSKQMSALHSVANTPQGGISNIPWAPEVPTDFKDG